MICEEVTFNLPWGKIAGKVWTGRKGPNVLCIHGMFSNASCYDKLIPLVLEKLGGIWCCIDLPGSGRSDSHPSGMIVDMLQYVHDLHRVVDELAWEKFHLMAHSASTSLALYLASFLPNNVESVVSFDLVIYNVLFYGTFWSERVHVLLEKYMSDYTPRVYTKEKALDKIQSSRVADISEESLEILFSRSAVPVPGGYILNNDPRFNKAYMYTTLTMEMHQALIREMRCPTLLILHGSHPHLINLPHCKLTIDTLKDHLGSQLSIVTIEGSHDMIMENPGLVIAKLQDHFTRVSSKL